MTKISAARIAEISATLKAITIGCIIFLAMAPLGFELRGFLCLDPLSNLLEVLYAATVVLASIVAFLFNAAYDNAKHQILALGSLGSIITGVMLSAVIV